MYTIINSSLNLRYATEKALPKIKSLTSNIGNDRHTIDDGTGVRGTGVKCDSTVQRLYRYVIFYLVQGI